MAEPIAVVRRTVMTQQVQITTGARLHFGLLSHFVYGSDAAADRLGAARQFGGVGLMIGKPGFVLRASRARSDEVVGDPQWCGRLAQVADHCRARCGKGNQAGGVRWELLRSLPPHAGLGSGTQLGLAVAAALSLLAGEAGVPVIELARRAGRGQRSAIGIHGFQQGGLLIDGGKGDGEDVSPLVARACVPEGWRFVLLVPRGVAGVSGAREQRLFDQLSPMTDSQSGRLARLALHELLPSARDAHCDRFGEALFEFGQAVGEYFAPVQGGVYAEPAFRELVPRLRRRGVRGVGQSSWGPTLFVLCPDDAAARGLCQELKSEPACRDCELVIAAPCNQGAVVEERQNAIDCASHGQ